ncbi:alpha/beta hydrolase [Nocardioides sp. Soil805]|uniref:alpha/beta hydrolase n=1 Tax=Nocardioides sp. Soil805 TaxID=1736416 RepID=UPI001F270A02|nr:alpha/beta fold hydrolase [Nocardioides sp. Soil805]
MRNPLKRGGAAAPVEPVDPEVTRPFSAPARPELTGGRRVGVLLQHGFTGSPYSMKPWGSALAERGYAVEVPLLPGHGTSWQDCNTVGWQDWYDAVSRTFARLRAENDAVVVGGLSMGGSLVLRLAADHPDEVAGVVLVNPAVNTTRLDVKALPVLKRVVASMPGIANDIKKPGVEELGYTRTPLRAADSMMREGWKPLRSDLARVTAPVLLFKSTVDHVVDPSSLDIIRSNVSSRDFTERMLTESYHVATLDNDAETIFAESADFVARVSAG